MVLVGLLSCNTIPSQRKSVEDVASCTNVEYYLTDSEKEMIGGMNNFAFRLFRQLAVSNEGQNLIVSPIGVIYSLNLLANGADGETLDLLKYQMGSKYSTEDVNHFTRKMMIEQAKVTKDGFTGCLDASMKSANLFVYGTQYDVKKDFVKPVEYYFFADVTDAANCNVPLPFDSNQYAYLQNTVTFNGPWLQDFSAEAIEADTFYVTKDKFQIVQMMNKEDHEHVYQYMQCDEFEMLRMPFTGAFRMEIVLPRKGLSVVELLKDFDVQKLVKSSKKLKTYDILNIGVPKFNQKNTVSLKEMLTANGLGPLFSSEANFGMISDNPLCLGDMVQDVQMMLDENGVHIDAVTSTSIISISEMLKPTKAKFLANRPFVFFILDAYNAICFAGVYSGTAEEKRPKSSSDGIDSFVVDDAGSAIIIPYRPGFGPVNEEKVYDVVEQMPSFPGGPAAMIEFIGRTIVYPVNALKQNLQGRVIVSFIVERDGSLSNAIVVKSVAPDMDKEALRVVKKMPRRIPGQQNGCKVRVKYTIPVTFRLDKQPVTPKKDTDKSQVIGG